MRFVLVLALLVTGCSFGGDVDPEIDAIARQMVADWEQRADVAEAEFRHTHGLAPDSDVLYLEVTLKAEEISDQVVDDVVRIAQRNCWLGTWQSCNAIYSVYSTAAPPSSDEPGSGRPIRTGRVDMSPEFEASYGPRPTMPGN